MKTFNGSTTRVQNAMVHNPIYDGPLYESVLERHFDSLASVSKHDYSSSNSSACNSPGPYNSISPDTVLQDNFHKNTRYLDRPIHQRSQVLPQHSSDSNNTSQSTTASVPAIMALKKNGKERNKLHLTLPLNNQNETCPNPGASDVHPSASTAAVNVSGSKMPSCMNPVMTFCCNVDANYTVMSPVARSMKAEVVELSPEDTEKYKE